jgi:hypothetical protein
MAGTPDPESFREEALQELIEIRQTLDRNLEDENCEPLLGCLAMALGQIANAITPANTSPGPDANGGFVASLTEAVMGCSSGLAAIANAINRLADVVEATGEQ